MQDLIVKHISGNSSPEEDQILFDWINADTKHLSEFNAQKKIWDLFDDHNNTLPEISVENAWVNFNDKLYKESTKNKRFFIFKIAAVFIVLLISGTFILNFKPQNKNNSIAAKSKNNTPPAINQIITKVINTENEVNLNSIPKKNKGIISPNLKSLDSTLIHKYTLIDSSTALLTSTSVLTALDQSPHQNRLVSLSGAGLFDIKPSTKNFQLETEELIIKVQGTKFNVQKSTVYDNVIEISVEEGVMDVQDKSNSSNLITITANQTYHFDKTTHQFKLVSSTEEKSKKSVFYKIFQKK
jgi:ferric-dicitrate binding protein FerR (iron transport regulator)